MISSSTTPEGTRRLADVVGKPGFAANALAAIEGVQCAPNAAAAVEQLHLAKAALGADQAVFASFIRDDDSRESFRFLVAADPIWCLTYQQQGWYTNDAWLLYAGTHSEPVSDSRIPLRTKRQREARILAAQHGTASAFIVPAPASAGLSRLGVLLLGSAQPGFFDSPASDTLKIFARSLAMELHEWWVRQIRMEILSSYRITHDDLQLLAHEQGGRSSKEIAELLGASVASVDSRFQRLCAKFHMPSRKAAARMAAEYGLIPACHRAN